jgi:endonuclease/exonuclease/phosphatase family metal-dependent hydrolase
MLKPPNPTPIRILTVNTHMGFALFNRRFVLHGLRDAVRETGADVVFLQEVQGTHSRRLARVADYPQMPHYEFIADTIWPQFAYGRNAIYPHGHHGNALLSKYPIVRHFNHDVSIDGQEPRGLLHCALHVPGAERPLHAICVHLGLRESHRARQLDALCELIGAEVPAASPLVVAGDFNDWRDRAHARLEHCAGLQEVFAHAHGRPARSYPALWPMLRLDRIYIRNVRAHAPLKLPLRPWSRLSDHAPLAAQIEL